MPPTSAMWPMATTNASSLPVGEDRLEQRVLGYVQTAPVGVVVDDDVAFLDLVDRDFLGAGLDEQRHPTDLSRAELGDRDHLAVGVGDGAGEMRGPR